MTERTLAAYFVAVASSAFVGWIVTSIAVPAILRSGAAFEVGVFLGAGCGGIMPIIILPEFLHQPRSLKSRIATACIAILAFVPVVVGFALAADLLGGVIVGFLALSIVVCSMWAAIDALRDRASRTRETQSSL